MHGEELLEAHAGEGMRRDVGTLQRWAFDDGRLLVQFIGYFANGFVGCGLVCCVINGTSGVGAPFLCDALHFTGSQGTLRWYWSDRSSGSSRLWCKVNDFYLKASESMSGVLGRVTFTVLAWRRTKVNTMACSNSTDSKRFLNLR